jgi:hypothetical protein
LTGAYALGNKEYDCREGKIRKVHRKRHNHTASVKWLNYSDPLPTIQECGYLKLPRRKRETRGRDLNEIDTNHSVCGGLREQLLDPGVQWLWWPAGISGGCKSSVKSIAGADRY